MKLDKYNLQARFIPALIGVIPIIILWINYATSEYRLIISTTIIGGVSVTLILTYVYVFLIRELAKVIQDLIFKNGFPSSYLIGLNNKNEVFSDQLISIYLAKIKEDFGFEVDRNNRLSIQEAFELALSRVRDSQIVLQQNIRYGFIRNLIGGCIFGFVGTLILLVINNIFSLPNMIFVNVFLFVIYLIPLLLTKYLLKRNAESFVKSVVNSYLSC